MNRYNFEKENMFLKEILKEDKGSYAIREADDDKMENKKNQEKKWFMSAI